MASHRNHIHRTRSTSNTRSRFPVLLSILLTTVLSSTPVYSAGTPGAGEEKIPDGQTASELAVEYYQTGIAHKERAWQKQTAAAAADEAQQAGLLDEAQAEFQAAVTAQGKALKLHLNYHQAANELGYALRQTGDYRKALGAYNFALSIKPDFYPAIEYRGEAYLALGMLEQTKSAYMTLFRNDPGLAAQLLNAMASAEIDEPDFQSWVTERKTLANLTGQIDSDAQKNWTD